MYRAVIYFDGEPALKFENEEVSAVVAEAVEYMTHSKCGASELRVFKIIEEEVKRIP